MPARPVLFASADTNSAAAYYILGTQLLEQEPARAAAAFYWAHRLNPRWADALYGRRVALLMTDPARLVRYMDGVRSTVRSAEIAAIDSLQLRALTIDPFLVQKFDRQLLTRYLTHSLNDEMARAGGSAGNMALAAHLVQTWLGDSRTDPFMRAWFAYSEGRYPQALGEYERALRRARNKSRLRTDVARLHYLSGNYDQALEHFTLAITEMRAEDDRDIVYLYQSKALLEQSVGAVHEKAGRADAAREAYGRALTEDLAYYPAHQRLGWLSLMAGDTAAAVSELALAAEAAADDGAVQYEHGLILALARQFDEAKAALRRAIAVEPHFAAPYLLLAKVQDVTSDPETPATYRQYVARAMRDDPELAAAQARLAEITPPGQ
ncbi:MAG TPA: tetratricopeptide repeat protein [Longimicrobiaceae bacterium]|nr:tetratricopeptide repeat protein [Longimicrobiaceae bacterium]